MISVEKCLSSETKKISNKSCLLQMPVEGQTSVRKENGAVEDHPIQIIYFEKPDEKIDPGGKTVTIINNEKLNSLLEKIGGRPIVIIAICGRSRQGKSLILGYMVRCLVAMEQDDNTATKWMDWEHKRRPVKAFKFRSGTEAETQGIWVWSRPFIVKNAEGEEVAVLLVDTQGTEDANTKDSDMNLIVGLTLLFSSVTILNIFHNLQEDIFKSLNSYMEYGRYAKDTGGANQETEKCFQKLFFLIRDWNIPTSYEPGDGTLFLEEKLRITPDQPRENQIIREKIQENFSELGCFLLPFIGKCAINNPFFDGSIAQLDNEFAINLEWLINDLIHPSSLIPKTILGKQVTAADLRNLIHTYVGFFNSDNTITATSMWDATCQITNDKVVNESTKMYQDTFTRALEGSGSYLPVTSLMNSHASAESTALNHFKTTRKFGDKDKMKLFEGKLLASIPKLFEQFNQTNANNREKFLANLKSEVEMNFKNALNEEVPLASASESTFYTENKINQQGFLCGTKILKEAKSQIPKDEDQQEKDELGQLLDEILQNVLMNHLRDNRARLQDAEKKVDSLREEYASEYKTRMETLIQNGVWAHEELVGNHNSVMTELWKEFQANILQYNADFRHASEKQFRVRMDTEFKNVETVHQLHLKQLEACALEQIDAQGKSYEKQVATYSQQESDYSLDEMEKVHKEQVELIMNQFENPFPTGIAIHDQLQNKLREQLNAAFATSTAHLNEERRILEERCRSLIDQLFEQYCDQMKLACDEIGGIDDSGRAGELDKSHHSLATRVLQEFDGCEGGSEQTGRGKQIREKFKAQLATKMQSHLVSVKHNDLADQCVNWCVADYVEKMKQAMKESRTLQEFENKDKLIASEVLKKLPEKWTTMFGHEAPPVADKTRKSLEQKLGKCFD